MTDRFQLQLTAWEMFVNKLSFKIGRQKTTITSLKAEIDRLDEIIAEIKSVTVPGGEGLSGSESAAIFSMQNQDYYEQVNTRAKINEALVAEESTLADLRTELEAWVKQRDELRMKLGKTGTSGTD